MKKKINNKYAFGTYKPNKNCKPVTYKGTEYLSKAQCIALEGITRKELDAYLKDEESKTSTKEIKESVREFEEKDKLSNDYFNVANF